MSKFGITPQIKQSEFSAMVIKKCIPDLTINQKFAIMEVLLDDIHSHYSHDINSAYSGVKPKAFNI